MTTLAALGHRQMPEVMYLDWLISARTDGESYYKTDTAAPRFDPRENAPDPDMPYQTLTNGYYDECPLCDSLITIGEVRLNTNTGKIIGFVQRDTLRSEATLEPTVVSRWLSVDPVVHPYESPYVGFANNPIYFIDPTGTVAGDYFTASGTFLGTDQNIGDGKNYVVPAPKDQARALTSRVTKGYIDPSQLSSTQEIFIPNSPERQQMMDGVKRSNNPTTPGPLLMKSAIPDTKGGYHDEGGIFYDPDGPGGNGPILADAKAGSAIKLTPPGSQNQTSGNTNQPAPAEMSYKLVNLPSDYSNVVSYYHVHPSGSTTYVNQQGRTLPWGFNQPPSSTDLKNYPRYATPPNLAPNFFVLGAQSKKVYLYNKTGVIATFSFSQWKKSGPIR